MCFNMRMKYITAFFVLFTAIVMTGCLSPEDNTGRLRHRSVNVELSGLDWIEVSYYPIDNDPLVKDPCRLSIFGSGEVVFKTGRSPQIWDSFSAQVEDPNWNDVFSDRIHLSQEEMELVFQAFVDEGLIPQRVYTRAAKEVEKPYVKFAAQVGREKVRRVTDNKFLVALVEEALENFSQTIAQAAAARRGGVQP